MTAMRAIPNKQTNDGSPEDLQIAVYDGQASASVRRAADAIRSLF